MTATDAVPAIGVAVDEMEERAEMLSTFSDPNLEVYQVTTNLDHQAHTPKMTNGHHFFTPDSKRFVFARMRDAAVDQPGPSHGGYEWTLCDIDDGFKLRRLTAEPRVNAGVLDNAGEYLYYFVDNSGQPKPNLEFKRVGLDTFKTETLMVLDSPVEGVGRVPRGGYMYGWGSLRRDGKALCASCSFYTDTDPLFATLIVDMEAFTARTFIFDPYNWRPVGDYYRGDDPRYLNHMLMGKTHMRSGCDVNGKWYQEKDPDYPGFGTLHVVTDEGEQMATIPIGDKGEGVDHPSWRGGKYEIVTHTSSFTTAPFWRGIMLCAEPIACAKEDETKGARIPGARRFELTRKIKRPDECHHAWDQSGTCVVADSEGWAGRGAPVPMGPAAYMWIGAVREPDSEDPYVVTKHLLSPRSSWSGNYWTEVQPAMSPDCQTIFFNSDWLCKTGHPQLFAVKGFTFP